MKLNFHCLPKKKSRKKYLEIKPVSLWKCGVFTWAARFATHWNQNSHTITKNSNLKSQKEMKEILGSHAKNLEICLETWPKHIFSWNFSYVIQDQCLKMKFKIFSLLQWTCFGPDLISMLIFRVYNCFILYAVSFSFFFQVSQELTPGSEAKASSINCIQLLLSIQQLLIHFVDFPWPSFLLLCSPITFPLMISPLIITSTRSVARECEIQMSRKWLYKFMLRIRRESWKCYLKMGLGFSNDFIQLYLSL